MVSNEIEFKYSNKNLKIHKNTSLLGIQYSGKGTTDNHTFLNDYVQLSISFDFFN